MRKYIRLLAILVFFAPLRASAGTPTFCPPSAECASSMVATCDNPSLLEATGILGANQQTMCNIDALSVPVNEAGNYRICYTVFGNATSDPHDGVNVWVSGPPDEPYIDVQILPPQAVWTFPSSTGVSGCQDVHVDAPFTATVDFAFDNDLNFTAPNEEWGGRAPKMPFPSWLTIEKMR